LEEFYRVGALIQGLLSFLPQQLRLIWLQEGDLKVRVVVFADNTVMAHAIRHTLRYTVGVKLVGTFDSRETVDDRVADLRPDAVLVDDTPINHELAIERMREIEVVVPDSKVLLLTMNMNEQRLEEAFLAGASAVVSKDLHAVMLGALVREICNGSVVTCLKPPSTSAQEEDCPLTTRELEILRLVAEGYTNGRIAKELRVTEQTVKFHLSNVYRKLGVSNRTEASRYIDRCDSRRKPGADVIMHPALAASQNTASRPRKRPVPKGAVAS
jgi:DNA-binding NarL/FixJ family response regulator